MIQLANMNKVNHGHVHMPESYVGQNMTRPCVVTFYGSDNGVIIFTHQRLSNATSGQCLQDRIINDTIYQGPCSEQRVYFSKVTTIVLAVENPIQNDFILHFTGNQSLIFQLTGRVNSIITNKYILTQLYFICIRIHLGI